MYIIQSKVRDVHLLNCLHVQDKLDIGMFRFLSAGAVERLKLCDNTNIAPGLHINNGERTYPLSLSVVNGQQYYVLWCTRQV